MEVRSGQPVTITVHTRVNNVLQTLGDLECVVALNGVRIVSAVTITPVTTGEYRVAFTVPFNASLGSIVELIASTASLADSDVVWRGIAVTDGNVAVDHNYGGTNALQVTLPDLVTPVADVEIKAYRKSDYLASVFTVRAYSTSDANGAYITPLFLAAGVTYTITYEKTGFVDEVFDLTPA